MFKLFKKHAVLDADAEQELLTTYYKSKTTKSGTKRVELSDRHCRLWCAAAEGLLILCIRDRDYHYF